jgi:hypothetical protein
VSHRRAARLVTAAAALASGLLAAALAAAPSLADTPPSSTPGAGCTGQSCWVSMESRFITLSGSYTSGATASVPVPPPPCWMTPLLGGPAMYAAYKSGIGQTVGPNGQSANAGLGPFIKQIIAHKNDPGMWYSPEMLATAAGFACGNKLPLLAWVPPGTAPPPPPIPPAALAAYAYDHFKIPSPVVVVNPAGQNYVTLPAYVWATGPGGGPMPRRLTITATAAGPGGASVTLTATAGQLQASAQAGATVYSPCPSASGSAYPVGHPPKNSGPGTTPDCGVVFTAPSLGNMITAQVMYGITVAGANVRFAPIGVQGSKTVRVAEIQNLNG